MWNNVINAWWQLVFYPATDAPRFHKGMIALIAVSVATLIVTWLVWYLERREVAIRSDRSVDAERIRNDSTDAPPDEKHSPLENSAPSQQ